MARIYTEEEKTRALALCAEVGQYRASKDLGIPQSTLTDWVRKAGQRSTGREKMQAALEAREARIAAARAELKERLLARCLDLEQRMDEPHIDFKSSGPLGPVEVTFPKATAQACQQYATSIGILLDKFRLECGEVTAREEHHTTSDIDRDIDGLLAELAGREEAVAEGPTETAPGAPTVDAPCPD